MDAVGALSALAHEGRLEIFRLLVRRAPDAVPAGELAAALGVQATTLSNQLAKLEQERLVVSRRAGRSVLYAADLERAGALLGFLAAACCKGRPEVCLPAAGPLLSWSQPATPRHREDDQMSDASTSDQATVYNVLFLCTHNSARSVFGEAILNRIGRLGEGKAQFKGYSAGSHPREEIHPQTKTLLEGLNFDVSGFKPKDWSEFAAPGAPELHFVFTVCDNAANEVCPVWPGQPMSAHWGVADPSAAEGTETEKALAFTEAYRHLYNRLTAFTALPIASLDSLALQKQLDDIGRMRAPAPETA
ncbi:MAG: metalloregulator ArsR/SmtB family transcription factor [Pseudomonadota bacterium]